MKTKRKMSRWTLARRLQDLALRIAADKPIRIGRIAVRVPEQVVLQEEIETKDGETELELELIWPATADRATKRTTRTSARRRSGKKAP